MKKLSEKFVRNLSLVWYSTSPSGEAANQNREGCITKPVS